MTTANPFQMMATVDRPAVNQDDSGNSQPDDTGEPPITVNETIVRIEAGIDHTCAHRADELLNCWGRSDLISSTPTFPVAVFTIQGRHTCVVDMTGNLFCWGSNSMGQCSAPSDGSWTKTIAGAVHSCALDTDGGVECWGIDDDHPSWPDFRPTNRDWIHSAIHGPNAHMCNASRHNSPLLGT
jgi:hypothetical protein